MHPAEYLVILDILSHARGRSRERLERNLRHVDRVDLDSAISSLSDAGILIVRGESILPSEALTRLDSLRLIGV